MALYPISQVLSLTPPNRSKYRLRCPLHRSNNPSTLSVFKDELWYCFVCGKGGTAVELLSALEGISKSEAIGRLGLEAESWKLRRSAWELKKRIQAMQEQETPTRQAPKDLFPLGPAPFPLRNLHWPTLKHWGIRSTATGGVYFPFKTVEGEWFGWSIRQFGNVQPKYLNCPGLRKSAFLYGLYENQQQIQKRREVVLVEGQFDALAVWDAGFSNVCSSLGCGLAKDQARLLLPWVDRIRVLFDGDKAGREGAVELKCKWSNVFSVELLYLPDGEDPCSVGAEKLVSLLSSAS